jgi:hypothetical protein
LAFATTPSSVCAQSSDLPQKVDLSDPQFDWNPATMYAWPENSFAKDPWTEVALRLSRQTEQANCVPSVASSLRLGCSSFERILFKALGMQPSRTSDVIIRMGVQPDELDMLVTSYVAGAPFELRQSRWVWAILIPGPKSDVKGALGSLGIDLRKYNAEISWKIEDKETGQRGKFIGSGLPPFLSDASVHETPQGVMIAGSKIMGDIPVPPSHAVQQNLVWFRKYVKSK